MNMKYLLTLPLILFSLFSYSEGIVYYCVGEKTYIHYSPNVSIEVRDGKLESNKFSIKIDLQNKTMENEDLILWNPNVFDMKFTKGPFSGELQTIDCNDYRGNLRCVTSLGRIFSFDSKTNEYVSIFYNDGLFDTHFEERFVKSEFGKCEKFD